MRRPIARVALATGVAWGLFPATHLGNEREAIPIVQPAPEISAGPRRIATPRPVARNLNRTTPSTTIARTEVVEAPKLIETSIIPRLGEFGLQLVEPDKPKDSKEEPANAPNEFMVSAIGHCGSQFLIEQSEVNQELFNVSPTVWGRIDVLRGIRNVVGFPEFDGRLEHAESALSIGQDFDLRNSTGATAAVDYIAQTTRFVCQEVPG